MKKIGDSFKGIIGGFVCILIGIVLLWWNEGNNVKNLKTTAELEKLYKDVKSDSIDSSNEGTLVAVSGKLFNDEELTDTDFNITIKTPIMYRKVEVYQWVEKEDTTDDVTTYSYDKEWSETLIDSSDFHKSGYDNPTTKLYESETYTSSDVKVGVFSLTSKQVSMLNTDSVYTDYDKDAMEDMKLNVLDNYITNSNDLKKPKIGDVRISIRYNTSTEVSVLAVQTGDTFAPFTSSAGKTINRVRDGIHTGKEMIEEVKTENKIIKWVLRLFGTLFVVIGFASILKPISTIASFVPILGSIVGAAVGLVSFALGLSLSLIVIAVAWIRFRPILGISLLAIALVLIVFLIIRGKKSKKTEVTTE